MTIGHRSGVWRVVGCQAIGLDSAKFVDSPPERGWRLQLSARLWVPPRSEPDSSDRACQTRDSTEDADGDLVTPCPHEPDVTTVERAR